MGGLVHTCVSLSPCYHLPSRCSRWLLAFIYVYTFPFAFVGLLGYVTIPASMFICLGLYGLLLSAQELVRDSGVLCFGAKAVVGLTCLH